MTCTPPMTQYLQGPDSHPFTLRRSLTHESRLKREGDQNLLLWLYRCHCGMPRRCEDRIGGMSDAKTLHAENSNPGLFSIKSITWLSKHIGCDAFIELCAVNARWFASTLDDN